MVESWLVATHLTLFFDSRGSLHPQSLYQDEVDIVLWFGAITSVDVSRSTFQIPSGFPADRLREVIRHTDRKIQPECHPPEKRQWYPGGIHTNKASNIFKTYHLKCIFNLSGHIWPRPNPPKVGWRSSSQGEGVAQDHLERLQVEPESEFVAFERSQRRVSGPIHRLSWNPEEYKGIQTIRLEPSLLWFPDITLYNRYFAIYKKSPDNDSIMKASELGFV